MNRAAAFLIGAGCALLMLTPAALVAGVAVLVHIDREADTRAAQALMRQIRSGITDCVRDGRTMNCTQVSGGKSRPVVLAVAKP